MEKSNCIYPELTCVTNIWRVGEVWESNS